MALTKEQIIAMGGKKIDEATEAPSDPQGAIVDTPKKTYTKEEILKLGKKIDPSKDAQSKPALSNLDTAKATAEAFADELLLGNYPDIKAKAMGLIGNNVDETKERDATISRMNQLKEESPKLYYPAKVAGFAAPLAATMAFPAIAPATMAGKLVEGGKAAQLAAKGLGTVGLGVAQGLLTRPEVKEGVPTELQPMARLEQGAVGGLLGKGGELVGRGVGKAAEVVKQVPGKLRELADRQVLKGLGFIQSTLKQEKLVPGEKSAEAVVDTAKKYALNDGVSSIHDVYAKSKNALNEVGQKIGDIYDAAKDKFTPINTTELADKLRAKISDNAPALSADKAKFLEKFDNEINSIINSDINDPREMNSVIQNIGQKAFESKLKSKSYKEKAYKAIYSELRETLNQNIENAAKKIDPESSSAIRELNKDYSNLLKSTKAAEGGVLRDVGNRFISPSDYLSGAAAAGTAYASNPEGLSLEKLGKTAMVGAAGALGNKVLRGASPLIGKGLLKASEKTQSLSKMPQGLIDAINTSSKNPMINRATDRLAGGLIGHE